ncbi:MAG: hypothetical protein SOR50_07555 [Blautia sp.]|nr:hypothetical protein [Blautia sp.]
MKKKVRFCIICAMTVSLFGTVQVPAAGKAKEGQEEQQQQDDSESKASYLSQFDAGSYVELADYSSIPVEANEGDTSGIENDIGDYLLKNSTFVKELPTPFVNRNTSTLKDQLQNYADTYKMSLADFMKYYDSSLTEDTYEEYIQKLGADYSKKLVAMQAIADAEDLAVTDEELKEQIKTQAEAAGFSDVDEYKSAAKMDPEELREVMMSTKVFEFLEGKVTFNKK